jgi:hypothetical protein
MATKYIITIVITDINSKYSAEVLSMDIKANWLPPSHDITVNELRVSKMVTTEN